MMPKHKIVPQEVERRVVELMRNSLRKVFERHPGVSLAILFGSRAREKCASKFSDIDLLVDGSFNRDELLKDVGRALGRSAEIDLLMVQETPVKILKSALNEGSVLVCKDEGRLRDIWYRVAIEYPEIWMECALNLNRLLNLDCSLNKERILDQFANFIKSCNWLKKFLERHSAEAISASEGLQYEMKWSVFEAIQSLIDLCAGVVSDLKLGVAESYKGYVDKLVEEGTTPSELGVRLKGLTSFRNKLVHRYLGAEVEEVLAVAKELIELMPSVREWIEKMIKGSP